MGASSDPLPAWLASAKLGIFIHWGPYSVPAWAEPTGALGAVPEAEWDKQTLLSSEREMLGLYVSDHPLFGVEHVLSRLSDDQRSVITLRVLGDLSVDQTAQVLGKTAGSVKQLQRRGLVRLRSLMSTPEVAQ